MCSACRKSLAAVADTPTFNGLPTPISLCSSWGTWQREMPHSRPLACPAAQIQASRGSGWRSACRHGCMSGWLIPSKSSTCAGEGGAGIGAGQARVGAAPVVPGQGNAPVLQDGAAVLLRGLRFAWVGLPAPNLLTMRGCRPRPGCYVG